MAPTGRSSSPIVELPDGIAVDVGAGHIYWTNMGSSPSTNDGSIERADLDGKNRQVIVPRAPRSRRSRSSSIRRTASSTGATAKACASCAQSRRLANRNARRDRPWRRRPARSDQMVRRDHHRPRARADLLDAKGPGQWRARPNLSRRCRNPHGREPPTKRSDIEVFFDRLPEPIDLELDLENRVLYWTDRGDPPRGNTVNRASIDAKPQAPEIVLTHLMEGIGIALDVPGNRMFVTDFAGSVYSARLDGSGERNSSLRAGQSHRRRLRRNLKSDRRRTDHVQ